MSETQTRNGMAVWFEIPANDFDRAVTFYETLFGGEFRREAIAGIRLAVFPYQQPGVGGAVVAGSVAEPGGSGTIVYLNCDGRLDEVIARVRPAGGHLEGPKVELPDGMGTFIHVLDPEGNRVGLHALT